MTTINIINPGVEYKAKNRGSLMTLSYDASRDQWIMVTVNAATDAWNRFPSYKAFDSLQEVADKYKTWTDIQELHATAVYEQLIAKVKSPTLA